MIRNESEYQEAVRRLRDERVRIDQYMQRLRGDGLAEAELARVMDPLHSFSLGLEEEIQRYERLKRGDLGDLDNLHGLGTSLVSLRIALGLTQRELAKRLQVAESQVSRDERNEYHGITVERATRILDALGVRLRSAYEPLPRREGKESGAEGQDEIG